MHHDDSRVIGPGRPEGGGGGGGEGTESTALVVIKWFWSLCAGNLALAQY